MPRAYLGGVLRCGSSKRSSLRAQRFGVLAKCVEPLPIDVAVHGTTVSHLTQLVGDLHVADVTGVPHLIACLCVAEDAFVHVSMGVRKKHNLHGARAKSVEMPHFRFMNLMRFTLGVTMAVLSTAGNVAISQSSKPSKKAQKAFAEALEAYRFLSYDLAVSHLDKAIHKSPEYAEAWFLKAQIYQDMDHPQLEATLVQALALDANLFPHGWVELAHVQWELGKYEEGLASLERLDALEMSRLAGDALTKRVGGSRAEVFRGRRRCNRCVARGFADAWAIEHNGPGVLWCA